MQCLCGETFAMTADARLPVSCGNQACQIVLTYVLSAHHRDTRLCVWLGRRTTALISWASCVVSGGRNMLRDVLMNIDLNVHNLRRKSQFDASPAGAGRLKA